MILHINILLRTKLLTLLIFEQYCLTHAPNSGMDILFFREESKMIPHSAFMDNPTVIAHVPSVMP